MKKMIMFAIFSGSMCIGFTGCKSQPTYIPMKYDYGYKYDAINKRNIYHHGRLVDYHISREHQHEFKEFDLSK